MRQLKCRWHLFPQDFWDYASLWAGNGLPDRLRAASDSNKSITAKAKDVASKAEEMGKQDAALATAKGDIQGTPSTP